MTILGERAVPWLRDLYLDRKGVSGQHTSSNLPRLGDNLFQPRDDTADQGPHGSFDSRPHRRDPFLWMSMHRPAILTSTGVALAATGAVVTIATIRGGAGRYRASGRS